MVRERTHWSMKQNREPRNKSMKIQSMNFDRGAEQFTGERTVFSTNGAGITGSPCERKGNLVLNFTQYTKINLK